MGEVLKLGITVNNNQPIQEVRSIEVLANKGIVGDRHFHDFNDPYNQLTLIESENIDEYNIKFGLDIWTKWVSSSAAKKNQKKFIINFQLRAYLI